MAQIPIKLSEQTDMPSTNQQKLVEHLKFMLNNAIIPILETKYDYQFVLKFVQVIKQYLSYSIQTKYMFNYNRSANMKNHTWLNPF